MVGVGFYITEGVRIFFSSLKRRFVKKRYDGTPEQICQQIIKDCFNGRYFQTSTGNFSQFWARDFGWCTASLLKLKYTDEVHQTLRYAINRYKKYKKITTTITPGGRAYDFPLEAVDSLPWLIHSIKISNFSYHSHKAFLNKEIRKFFEEFIDSHTGLVKPDLHVSSMKDFAVRKSSCYDNCTVAMLARDLASMKLINPFVKFDYTAMIKKHFWSGEFFYDDLARKNYVAGDANLFPFIFGIINDEKMLKSSLNSIIAAGLDKPFPLKYTASRDNINFIPEELLIRNYESNSIWMHMGPLYVKLVQQVDPELAKKYQKKYTELIEKHQNYLEVFFPNEKPFSTPFFYCDSGMLWAANYLTL